MPIKAGWRNASSALWDFSQAQSFSSQVFAMSASAPIEISYPSTACNKSAAKA